MNMVAAPGLEPGLPKAGMQILSLFSTLILLEI
jgi:hypothetical protein